MVLPAASAEPKCRAVKSRGKKRKLQEDIAELPPHVDINGSRQQLIDSLPCELEYPSWLSDAINQMKSTRSPAQTADHFLEVLSGTTLKTFHLKTMDPLSPTTVKQPGGQRSPVPLLKCLCHLAFVHARMKCTESQKPGTFRDSALSRFSLRQGLCRSSSL
jgi:hypothetical protein